MTERSADEGVQEAVDASRSRLADWGGIVGIVTMLTSSFTLEGPLLKGLGTACSVAAGLAIWQGIKDYCSNRLSSPMAGYLLSSGVLFLVLIGLLAARTSYPNTATPTGADGPRPNPHPAQTTSTYVMEATTSAAPSPTTQTPRPWPGEPAGSIFMTGSPSMSNNDNSLDFDNNEVTYELYDNNNFDVSSSNDGLGATNGASFTPWRAKQPPTLQQCRAIAEQLWVTNIAVEEFDEPSVYCLRSAEQRVGYLKTQSISYYSSREIRKINFSFVMWKGLGDD